MRVRHALPFTSSAKADWSTDLRLASLVSMMTTMVVVFRVVVLVDEELGERGTRVRVGKTRRRTWCQ